MSRYLYKKIQNISPESLNFQHSGLKLTTLRSDPNVFMVIIPPLRGTYHILWMTAKQSRCIGKTVSRDKKTAGIIDESQYRFQPVIQGTAEHFKQRHAGHQQFLTESRQTVADRP